MDTSDTAPRFRGSWAIPVAFLATVAATSVLVVLEVAGLAILMESVEVGVLVSDISDWILPTVIQAVLMAVTLFGLPAWMALHLFRAVHPAQGALVGGAVSAGVTGLLGLILMSGSPAGVFALLGILPGAVGGAVCLWVAYRR